MQTLADRYVLLERLGSGAMGVVWRARDEMLHREVAIKQLLLPDLDPRQVEEACERAMREGRIAARLQHPNAVGVFDVVIEDGKPCLVMEYLPSRSLSEVLKERGTLPFEETARIGAQVVAALAAAHEVGIVHRDIKPGNVLIGHDGRVKITDFGISRAADDVALTKTGRLSGTLAYLAPELARGAEPDPAADMFSFGATLYAMTEGQPPFGRTENEFGLLYKISTGQVTPPARSGPLTPLLTRLLAIEPADRPTAAQVVEELAAHTASRSGRRTGILVAAVVLVFLVVAAAVTAPLLFGRDQAAGSGSGSTGQSASKTPETPAALTTKDVDTFIRQHFAKLPKDTAGARQDWVPEARPAVQTDDQYWKRYEVVAIYGEPRISSTAQDDQRYSVGLDLTLRKQGAREHDVSIEGFRLDLVVKDGKLLIAHAREASG
ncbi:serine/threonine-protein kinase [Lentzea nigeriaca]|uniref:serine/threonine-protein kinase n=1 Tax=Lentzea nigeriaca TaxID=1128665 RepID=UPI0027DD8E6F|nr:serine/threonine-protein kinase [Lentzea nigeriaca]MBM7860339.1 serine/threonine protein kinase [Lentzea nigeriaca]